MSSIHGGNIFEASRRFGIPAKQIIDFSASINPLGMSPNADKAISAGIESVIHYPEPESRELKETLSSHLGLKPAHILVGNGSTELLFLLCRAFSPRKAIIPVPSFSGYESAVLSSGGRCLFLKLSEKEGFHVNIGSIAAQLNKADMLFICNPNNPVGAITAKKDLLMLAELCRRQKTMLVVDEAFIDFTSDSTNNTVVREAVKNPYLLVVRSLTKFFAIPGLRAGYLAGSEQTIRRVGKCHYPWSLNTIAQLAASAGIKDHFYMRKTRDYIEQERGCLFKELQNIRCVKPYPSSANYIFIKLRPPGLNAGQLSEKLGKRGILIRDCSNFRGLNNRFIRIAVRTRKENRKLLNAIREVLQ